MVVRTVCPGSSADRASNLQAKGCGHESCIGHTFSSFIYLDLLKGEVSLDLPCLYFSFKSQGPVVQS